MLVGAGGHAREVAEIVEHSRRERGTPGLLGFIDEDPTSFGKDIDGFPVLGGTDWLKENQEKARAIVAIGNISVRKRLGEQLSEWGVHLATAISPLAHISKRCQIGEGSMVFPGVVLSTNVTIGKHVILGVYSNVSHDSTVGDYSFLCPASMVTGGVTIGREVLLGTNSSVIPERSVGDRSIVGAGACVVKDVPSDVTALGVPAVW